MRLHVEDTRAACRTVPRREGQLGEGTHRPHGVVVPEAATDRCPRTPDQVRDAPRTTRSGSRPRNRAPTVANNRAAPVQAAVSSTGIRRSPGRPTKPPSRRVRPTCRRDTAEREPYPDICPADRPGQHRRRSGRTSATLTDSAVLRARRRLQAWSTYRDRPLRRAPLPRGIRCRLRLRGRPAASCRPRRAGPAGDRTFLIGRCACGAPGQGFDGTPNDGRMRPESCGSCAPPRGSRAPSSRASASAWSSPGRDDGRRVAS